VACCPCSTVLLPMPFSSSVFATAQIQRKFSTEWDLVCSWSRTASHRWKVRSAIPRDLMSPHVFCAVVRNRDWSCVNESDACSLSSRRFTALRKNGYRYWEVLQFNYDKTTR
jgi:hypothetical protein